MTQAGAREPVAGTTLERMRQSLAALAPDTLQIEDESAAHAGHAGARSGGGHYHVVIVSPRFAGQSRVMRHRMVYEALGGMMQREIHALALETYAPDEL